MQALAANPAWAQAQFAQWQLLHQLAASSTMDPWQVFLPSGEDGETTGGQSSMDTGTDRIGVSKPNPVLSQGQEVVTLSRAGVLTPNPAQRWSQKTKTIDRTGVVTPGPAVIWV